MVGDSNDESKCFEKLLLIDAQVSRLQKAFVNNSSAQIKLSKTHLSKMVLLRGFSLLETIKLSGFLLNSGNCYLSEVAKNKIMLNLKKRHSNFFKKNTGLILLSEKLNKKVSSITGSKSTLKKMR